MVLDRAGLPKGRGVYHNLATFGQAGTWDGEAKFSGTTSKFSMTLPAAAVAPIAGQAAPRAASPTKTDALGVKPICTRVPQCPLHTVSLSDVIGAGRPVAVLFATPALCTSQYCGPVLDELLGIKKPYEEKITFVHVDIYKDLKATSEVAHRHGVVTAQRAVALHDRRGRHHRVAPRHRVRDEGDQAGARPARVGQRRFVVFRAGLRAVLFFATRFLAGRFAVFRTTRFFATVFLAGFRATFFATRFLATRFFAGRFTDFLAGRFAVFRTDALLRDLLLGRLPRHLLRRVASSLAASSRDASPISSPPASLPACRATFFAGRFFADRLLGRCARRRCGPEPPVQERAEAR